jgi:oxygen-independent coproporphyrinogen-3 oxidase
MPLTTLSTAPTAPQQTEVGSYFVANYPPFSAWRPEHLPAITAALGAPPAGGAQVPLGLYLHIPFCRKRCKFCYFRVYTDKNADEVETYLSALSREIDLYADRPGLTGRQFEFVYFGGGTPSFLSHAQLERLIERINRRWTWSSAREVTFECEPGTLKQSKLQTIRKIGVTRLSLGVEHFDDEILALNGRAHRSKEILQAWDWVRQAGFPQVNIDLIAGMLGETGDKWKLAVDKALALDADSVTIYQMEVPHNTTIAREARTAGDGHVPVATWAQKRAWVDHAFRQFEAAGYQISSAYTLVRPERHRGFVYRDSLWHGADMVATGVASFGHFQGIHYQNVDQWEPFVGMIENGQLPLHRALATTPHQRLVREMILQLKLGTIDPAYFAGKFGVDISEQFSAVWRELEQEGLAVLLPGRINLSRAGLLRIDSLLSRFFEPEYRNVRYT